MMEYQEKEHEDKQNSEKEVRIIWDQGDDLPVNYANHFYVTHQGGAEFHLTFGHLIPPLTIGMKKSELPDILKISPVSRIVLSPDAIRVLIEVLQNNLAKFEAKKGKNND